MSRYWEYLRLERHFADVYRQGASYAYSTKSMATIFPDDVKWNNFDDVLDALGYQGWELVTKDGEDTFLFKRRR
jgi:hypothetical protein